MKSSIYQKLDHLPEINQEEVNKFYQERQQSKHRFDPASSLVQKQQSQRNESFSHGSFKNMYRRKSLMHKLKEDESMFTSFNNSVDYDRSLSQSLLRKSTHRTVYENTQHEQHHLRSNPNEQSAQILHDKSHNHSSLQQSRQSLYGSGSSDSFINRLKRRSNSVQIQSTPTPFCGQRQQKGTVPLSTILKKYQEEVSRLQQQSTVNEGNFMSFSKVQLPKEQSKKTKDQLNKQNYQTFNPSAHIMPELNKATKTDNRLPQVVEQCIDKWRDLEIEQLRAERLYNKRKDAQKPDSITVNTVLQENSQKPSQYDKQKNDKPQQTDSKSQQNERMLKQNEEYIKQLEKQNIQYKKFVQSIQKMKNTLEDFDFHNCKLQTTQKPKISCQNNEPTNEPETNLKELWRWIKSLPPKKPHLTKKQHIR